MAKFLLLWKMDHTKIPIDPKERAAGWKPLMDMVKQDLEKGVTKEWGVFAGEPRGFWVVEGTVAEVDSLAQQYVPFAEFETHPLVSMSEVDEMIERMSQA